MLVYNREENFRLHCRFTEVLLLKRNKGSKNFLLLSFFMLPLSVIPNLLFCTLKTGLTGFASSLSSIIDGSSCFSGSAAGISADSDFSLVRLFLFSFFLSFSCFSFLSDLSLRCLRLDSLDSVFYGKKFKFHIFFRNILS